MDREAPAAQTISSPSAAQESTDQLPSTSSQSVIVADPEDAEEMDIPHGPVDKPSFWDAYDSEVSFRFRILRIKLLHHSERWTNI
ncbi:hypothetical protein ACLKA6_010215 [Drosophila palustris]